MGERAEFLKLGISKGIYSPSIIASRYNAMAEGGGFDTGRNYKQWKEAIKKHKGIDIDRDNTYDYQSYYNSNPDAAWAMLRDDPNVHFTDKFKTASHPTFSEESVYSGIKSQYNPKGIKGGKWVDDTRYIVSQDMLNDDSHNIPTLKDYLRRAESRPVTVFAPDGSVMLDEVTVTPKGNYYGMRGNIKAQGGPFDIDISSLGVTPHDARVQSEATKKRHTRPSKGSRTFGTSG